MHRGKSLETPGVSDPLSRSTDNATEMQSEIDQLDENYNWNLSPESCDRAKYSLFPCDFPVDIKIIQKT